ncbi:MAG: hypothetical protein GXO76_10080 [Calditrichaeota bacterium]|nr:hypothetical protein [Calditrichota bacterium]
MHFGLPAVDYIVIAFYLIFMLAIGFYFSRFMKGGKDFFVGGNLIPWWVSGISLYMTLFSAWTFTGAASFIYNTGWFGLLFFVSWPVSFIIGFLLSAKRWRRTRMTSPVEYIQTRFNKTTHLFLASLLALSMMYWPAHHLASLSKICAPTLFPNSMLAIDIFIVVTGIVILIYTISGGLWAVTVTDVVQFLILISICLVLVPTIFMSGDVGSVADFIHKVPPIKFHHVIRGKTTYTLWYIFGLFFVNIFGTAVGDKAQRYYSVKDEKAAMKVGWMAFALFLTAPILFGIPPLVGKVLWPNIHMLTQFSNVTKPDENIYIAVVLRYMPAGMIGIFLSAMMAASMSAMDSVWNAVSSIISVDIYKNMFNPDASEKAVLRVGRITMILLAVIAITLALVIIHSSYGVFTFTNIFFGLTGVPVAIPLFLGIMSRKISRWSAFSSILAGTVMASVARFVLHYSIGPQYVSTIVVTLIFIYVSRPYGRFYLKGKRWALAASVAMGGLLWSAFQTMSNNPNLGWHTLGRIFHGNVGHFLISAQFWALVAALAFVVISYYFSRLYAIDLKTPSPELKAFFQKMDTPIDVEKEVLSRGAKEINVFPMVGTISLGLAGVVLAVLLFPVARTKIAVNLAVAGLLALIGILMIISGRWTHTDNKSM